MTSRDRYQLGNVQTVTTMANHTSPLPRINDCPVCGAPVAGACIVRADKRPVHLNCASVDLARMLRRAQASTGGR